MTRLEDADADAVDVDATRCAIARVNNDVDAVNAKERAAACIITRLGTKRRKVRRGCVLFCTNAIATTTVCGIIRVHRSTPGGARSWWIKLASVHKSSIASADALAKTSDAIGGEPSRLARVGDDFASALEFLTHRMLG